MNIAKEQIWLLLVLKLKRKINWSTITFKQTQVCLRRNQIACKKLSEFPHNFLISIELNFSEYWTSGRYSQEGNNRWEWASTPPFLLFNYTNWHPKYNQPDDNEPGSCALLYFLDYSGFWADNVCIYSTRFVCESIVWSAVSCVYNF